jgi:hypothetical protein
MGYAVAAYRSCVVIATSEMIDHPTTKRTTMSSIIIDHSRVVNARVEGRT